MLCVRARCSVSLVCLRMKGIKHTRIWRKRNYILTSVQQQRQRCWTTMTEKRLSRFVISPRGEGLERAGSSRATTEAMADIMSRYVRAAVNEARRGLDDDDDGDDDMDVVIEVKSLHNARNGFPMDKDVVFTPLPDHSYVYKGDGCNIISVTTFIDQRLWPPFDAEAVSKAIVNSADYRSGVSPYSGMTEGQIRHQWTEKRNTAADRGTKIHEAIFKYLESGQTVKGKYFPEAFVTFLRRFPTLEIYRTEHAIFHPAARIAGSADLLVRDMRTGKFGLIDYKTNMGRDLQDEHNARGTTKNKKWNNKGAHWAVKDLVKSTFTKYLLQLNFYAKIYHDYYDIRIDSLFILQFPSEDLSDKEAYALIPTPFFATIDEIFDERIREVNALKENGK